MSKTYLVVLNESLSWILFYFVGRYLQKKLRTTVERLPINIVPFSWKTKNRWKNKGINSVLSENGSFIVKVQFVCQSHIPNLSIPICNKKQGENEERQFCST